MRMSFTLAFCLLIFLGVAQEESHIVISPNGINIRSQPTINAEVVGKLRFGEKVGVTDTTNVPDTLFKTEGQNKWVRIKTDDISGFVLNTFLMDTIQFGYYSYQMQRNFEAKNELNESYILLIPGLYCLNNVRYNPKMHWYAICAREDGESVIVRTEPQFYAIHEGVMFSLKISSQNGDDVQFILGSMNEINLRTIKAEGNQTRKTYLQEYPEFYVERKSNHDHILMIRTGEKYQVLNDFLEERNMIEGASIFFKGDINSDGNSDYVIWYGEKQSYVVLYISQIINGKLKYKAVAISYSTYCC